MKSFARDIEHTWTESTLLDHFQSNFLIHNGDGPLPWYASTGTYVLATLFGLSWLARIKFMDNTQYAKYELYKRIEEGEPKSLDQPIERFNNGAHTIRTNRRYKL